MLVNGDEGVDRDVVKTFKRMYEEKLTAWEALSDAEKYHKEEEYVEFKRKLWEKRFPNKPFRIDRDAPEEGDDGGDDDDLEIAIVGGNQNLLCPLTQSLLREPVTSQVCKHSYSREAIQQHIRIQSRGNQRAECPVAGCKHYIASRDLKQNKELARLVSRKEAQSRMEREVEDDEYVVMH
ncbi:zinc-finger of the MIZ type in Nse subunit-domain-containing protein [Fimicolochytrium jonesii]|uniref:zinc-finger of the MIZ type in Nse subunit-domain-containing protein n=1 Tax=Fimicolochytrium jonesii TaxID=1396493 RepID=UPI0022FE7AB0|nr:zinc-finger of the MIZ type in Nse subunit-domain-containing protein [Fimicolochytrium jonesii]KAI8825080.1 zinc-finger of the MIZ type in Nse subunit-domain-containing protein [Fimicolochytrium jonesii]